MGGNIEVFCTMRARECGDSLFTWQKTRNRGTCQGHTPSDLPPLVLSQPIYLKITPQSGYQALKKYHTYKPQQASLHKYGIVNG